MMKTFTVDPQYLVDIMLGQKVLDVRDTDTSYRGTVLVASNGIRQSGLPTRMAGALVNLNDVKPLNDGRFEWHFNLESLVRPFRVMGADGLFDVSTEIITEPVNWYDTAAENAAHAKIGAWIDGYVTEHPDLERIPRTDIPDEIAQMAISFDKWRLAYYPFIEKPNKQQKLAFRKVRYDVDEN
ncbi:hypothetical protein WOSG25_030010 [Weissella oryzae SG25]|uniref:ASCH domain-containing protein n=1 Tax=Weissella oryzae (strain DSM 25784 / JCM 18191 / LMG 30913 / SG25) TaxID=1329250 RepID=A0A069CRL4_WEIOS|nr:hypothetical protein [Weissella oryzae]GAK30405.1 hypothetical protein WOSG25_030010 [Weissella oryzae SG25]